VSAVSTSVWSSKTFLVDRSPKPDACTSAATSDTVATAANHLPPRSSSRHRHSSRPVASTMRPVTVIAVTAAQKPVVTMTTVPAPGQQHHAVRVPCVFGSKRQHRRANVVVSAPRRCRHRQEQTRQQHRYECRDEPHDSLLFLYYNSVGKAGATFDRNARGRPAADTKDFCDCTGRPGFKAEKPLVSKG
jgi:hypothetical protein